MPVLVEVAVGVAVDSDVDVVVGEVEVVEEFLGAQGLGMGALFSTPCVVEVLLELLLTSDAKGFEPNWDCAALSMGSWMSLYIL